MSVLRNAARRRRLRGWIKERGRRKESRRRNRQKKQEKEEDEGGDVDGSKLEHGEEDDNPGEEQRDEVESET